MSEENPTEGNRTSNRRSFYGPIGGATPQEDVRSGMDQITERLEKLEKDVTKKQDAILRQLHFLTSNFRSEKSASHSPAGFR
ncbi:hypothetical protein AK812_SmicGene35138 [Symbiodinium microadriaticum]|uniref:Uncharacterized protein n=1 Tax=Symbiodinium microadriaticum TaxID=2951 RepID=A0A1Q9CMC9_SYMMI|nr:hypothetical protein AK812_SmicGene35138 [Symbiodinium microadriaticum]